MGILNFRRSSADSRDVSSNTTPGLASAPATSQRSRETCRYAHAGTDWELQTLDSAGEKKGDEEPVREGRSGIKGRLFKGPGLGIYR